MSIIIRIFVLLVVVTETGSRQTGLAEGGLQPALWFSTGEIYKQVGVYSLLIFQSSRLECNPQTNTLNYK